MYCSKCGAKNDSEAIFCQQCGANFQPEPRLSHPPEPSAVVSQTPLKYAGFWNRFAAVFIDSIIIAIGGSLISLPFLVAKGMSKATTYQFWIILDFIFSLLIGWLYCTLLESSTKQATIGKMAVGIIVTDLNENRISFGRANGRWWGKSISFLILGIGYIMAGFTRKKQALHDVMADTLVLGRPEGIRTWLTTTIIGGMIVTLLVVTCFILINSKPKEVSETYGSAPSTQSSKNLKELGNINQDLNKREEFYNEITRLVPDYERINGAPSFITWLYQIDRNTGRRKTEILQEAYNRFDVNAVASFFEDYINRDSKSPQTPPISSQPPSSSPKDDGSHHYNLGLILRNQGKNDEAIEYFTKALALDPNNYKAFFNRARCYEGISKYDRAIEDYDKAININPKYAKAYNNRGLVYLQKGQYDKAIENLTQAITVDPNFVEAYFNRGVVYEAKDETGNAILDFQRSCSKGESDGCKKLKTLGRIIDCPKCFRELKVPVGRHGRVFCPLCNFGFEIPENF